MRIYQCTRAYKMRISVYARLLNVNISVRVLMKCAYQCTRAYKMRIYQCTRAYEMRISVYACL